MNGGIVVRLGARRALRCKRWWFVLLAVSTMAGLAACRGSGGESVDASTCGNGVIDLGEICDGSALDGVTCADIGFDIGVLACAVDCRGFETAGCTHTCRPSCGERVCGPDPTCGVSCGDCNQGSCNAEGACVLPAPTRFAAATTWSVPAGGTYLSGFDGLAGSQGDGDAGVVGRGEAWSTLDLSGDGLPDLVVTARAGTRSGYHWWSEVFGYGTSPFWKVYRNTGTGFEPTHQAWSVPVGGTYLSGFDGLAGNQGNGDAEVVGRGEAWSTLDLGGDGLPDLVVTARAVARSGYYWWSEVFGYDASPYWKVYRNTGSGFEPTHQAWSVPTGGAYLSGFDGIAGKQGHSDSGVVGNGQAWSTVDLTGDGLPDLVVTARAVARSGYYWWSEVFGYDTSPYWKVYRNTGAGFEPTPQTWSVPSGGAYLSGFDGLAGSQGHGDAGVVGRGEAWSTVDLTGDGLPDLVVTARAAARSGYYWWSEVFGYGTSPYWKVYRNTGSGFEPTHQAWSVPVGGRYLSGFDGLAGSQGGGEAEVVGHGQAWSTVDLTGDGLPDLVVTAEAGTRSGYYWWSEVFGQGTSPHWKVYRNTGTGFEPTPQTWSVPSGGTYLSGFDALAGRQGHGDAGVVGQGEAWSTLDLGGDGLPDLVVTAKAVTRSGYYWWSEVFGYGTSPFWKVYPAAP